MANLPTSRQWRIFTMEDAWHEGARRFIVSTLDDFWHVYHQLPPNFKHFYELIPERFPCKMYFDLEFSRSANPSLRGHEDQIMHLVKEALCRYFRQAFHFLLDMACHVIELDSSTDDKFSRHLIVDCGYYFRNNQSLAPVVSDFLHKLPSLIWEQQEAIEKYFCVKPPSTQDNSARVPLIDQSVYSKNRTFRLVDSSKFGKSAIFKFIHKGGGGRESLTFEDFQRSLVCPSPDIMPEQLEFFPHPNILASPHSPSAPHSAALSLAAATPLFSAPASKQEFERVAANDLRDLDDFITHIINLEPYVEDPSRGASIKDRLFLTATKIQYTIKGSRYCDKVSRQHRSNNVVIMVDLQLGVYYRQCFDESCKRLYPHPILHPLPAYFRQQLVVENLLTDEDFLHIDLSSFK
jgi:DNA-directed primase/polymerase protein